MNVATAPASAASTLQRLRVMIVDDAVVVRGLFTRWVESEPDLQVVASLRGAREAIDQMTKLDPDVVILDIEMPDLDGISALPMLLAKKRDLVVIMASTLTRRNAEISLKALSLGAADYIPKPDANREVTGSADFRRDLIEKVRQLGLRARRNRADAIARFAAVERPAQRVRPQPEQNLALHPWSSAPPRVLVIGSSTGGPQALNTVLSQCAPVFERAPVLITQHMPPTFTTLLAEHLGRITGRPTREAQHGEEINAGTIYLAPGGKHMSVTRRDGTAVVALDDGPLINFCKPAVDPLFSSAASVWGSWVLGVVLTGMGADGTRGAQSIVGNGGSVIAQDEATSVVWGMPGQVAQAGLCSAILPLPQIAPKLVRLFAGERS